MSDTHKTESLHDQIMRLPCTPPKDANVNQSISYKSGHRDARHAAAELAAEHEAEQQQELTAIEAMARMLEGGEWAEHVGQLGGPIAQRLETEITRMHNEQHSGTWVPSADHDRIVNKLRLDNEQLREGLRQSALSGVQAEQERDQLVWQCKELEAALHSKEAFYQDALHSHVSLAKQRDQLAERCRELEAVIEQRNGECSWKHKEIERLRVLLQQVPTSLLSRHGYNQTAARIDAALEASQ